jgi:RNA polymerase sigma-70 factor, ECF subfamily
VPAPAPLTAADDAELLGRSAGGDRAAFEAFVERHEAAVLRFARALTPDADRAEDALQECFIAAWRGAAGYGGGPSARGWLLAIARNAVRRQFRRHAGEPRHHLSLDELAEEAGFGRDGDDGEIDRLEARELVERGFAALSPEDREVLVLRELEGFSGEETAALLGLTLAAVKSRLHRARLRFVGTLQGASHGT